MGATRNNPVATQNWGVPFVGRNTGIPFRSRYPYFVDAENGNDGRAGLSPADALASVSEALSRAQSGDTILIYPGSYVENIVVPDGLDYISLIAAQVNGYGRPDIVPDSGLALNSGAAQGLYAWGIRFAAPAADTDLVLQQGNGFVYEWCVFDGDSTQGDAKGLLRLKGNDTDDAYTASEGQIINCLFRGSGGLGIIFDTAEPTVGVGSSDNLITKCKFVGNDQADIATADTGPGTYSCQRTDIGPDNVFADKNKTCYIDLTTSNGGAAGDQTGTIVGNWFAADAINTTRVKMVGTGFTFQGNYDTVSVVDGSGLD